MTVKALAERLSLECISEGDGDRVVAGCYVGDLLSRVMGRAQPGDVWVTIMSNVNVAAVASFSDVACVILSEGIKPDENLIGKLDDIDAAVYKTTMTSYEVAWKVYEAIGAKA